MNDVIIRNNKNNRNNNSNSNFKVKITTYFVIRNDKVTG
jgi:hypothetical protein